MNVVLADDHHIVREGLRHLLEKEKDIKVVGLADNGRIAVKLTGEHKPDVVVMDLTMPEMNGIDATKRIMDNDGTMKVLALSMHSDRRYVVAALAAGAKGYLLKDCAAEELVGALRSVAFGQNYLSPKITGVIITDYLKNVPQEGHFSNSPLSSREREVLQLVAEGKNTKEIAFNLDVSVKTVETHRQQIMKKLNLFSVADLTKYALREGLTSL